MPNHVPLDVRRQMNALEDFLAIVKQIPPHTSEGAGVVAAAILVVAARLESLEDALVAGLPTAGEGV